MTIDGVLSGYVIEDTSFRLPGAENEKRGHRGVLEVSHLSWGRLI